MPFDLLIRSGTVIDGSNAPGRAADVGISGDRRRSASPPASSIRPGSTPARRRSPSSSPLPGVAVEAIMAGPWVSVSTDATARRRGHPVLGRGVPYPRTYGSAPRVLERHVRERSILGLETAVAKLSSVPAACLGLADRGLLRAGWKADVVIVDPETEAGERPGRILRRAA